MITGLLNTETIKIYRNETKHDDTAYAGTTCQIRLIEDGVTKDMLTIIILGDLSGDGYVTGVDEILLNRPLNSISALGGANLLAGY